MADQQTQAQEPPLPTTLKKAELKVSTRRGTFCAPLWRLFVSASPTASITQPPQRNFLCTDQFLFYLSCLPMYSVSIPFSVCIVHQISQQHSPPICWTASMEGRLVETNASQDESRTLRMFTFLSLLLFLFTYASTQVLSTFHQPLLFFLLLLFNVSYDGGTTGRFFTIL